MKNGRIYNSNKYPTLINLRIDSLVNHNYNHSYYYKQRNNRHSANAHYRINSSASNYKMNNQISSFNNNNNYTNYINDTSNIIENLRTTIQNTDRIITSNRRFLNNGILKNPKLSKSFKLRESKRHSKKEQNKIDDISVENELYNIELKGENEKNKKKKDKKLKEMNKIKHNIIKSNNEIGLQNKILESEINNYKRQILYRKYNSNINNYKQLMNKDFEKYKSLLQKSLAENTIYINNILKILQINMSLYNQIKNDYSTNALLFKKVENYNRENAENQILNEENENNFTNLKNENEDLIKRKEKMNLYFQNLKNEENNSILLHDSYYQKIKETDELIKQLTVTKNILEEELNKKTEKMNFNTKIINQNKMKLISYNNKIKIMMDDISNLNTDKNRLIQKNKQMKNKLINYMNSVYYSKKNNNDNILIGLKREYNQLKNINKEKKAQLKQKEQEIENLKRYIDMNNIHLGFYSKNNTFDSFNFNKDINDVNDIDIDNNIQLIIEENKELQKNLSNIFDIFDKEINKKDKIIETLQNKLIQEKSLNFKQNIDIKLNEKNNKHIISNIEKLGNNTHLNDYLSNKMNYENIIYNKLNNNKENNKQNIININNEYFKEKQEGNSHLTNEEIKTDENKNNDLNEAINKNKEINKNNFGKNKDNNDYKPNVVQKKETDDLAEIAEQISQYNLRRNLSNKNQQNNNDQLINMQQINNEKESKEQENEEYEYDLNEMILKNDEKSEEKLSTEKNLETGEKLLNNLDINNDNVNVQENNGEKNVNEEELEIDNINEENDEHDNFDNYQNHYKDEQNLDGIEHDDFYNDIKDINDIQNEYENDEEGDNYEVESI